MRSLEEIKRGIRNAPKPTEVVVDIEGGWDARVNIGPTGKYVHLALRSTQIAKIVPLTRAEAEEIAAALLYFAQEVD